MAQYQILYAQRAPKTIGSISIDVFVEEEHTKEATVTTNPVEDGSVASDHISLEPDTLTVEGFIGVSPLSGGASRVLDIDQALSTLHDSRELVTIVTGLRVYDDMAITEYKVTRNKEQGQALTFTLSATKVRKVTAQTVVLPQANIKAEAKKEADAVAPVGQEEPDPVAAFLAPIRTNVQSLFGFGSTP